MKKLLTILLCGFMVLGITGCGDKKNAEHSFLGKILEVSSNYIIVEPNEDEEERKSSDKLQIHMTDPGFSLSVGDFVKITYEGTVEESFPTKIGGTTKVEKLPTISFTPNVNFKVERYDQYDTIKYYPYFESDERTIYFAGDIKEFYIIEDSDITLKEYVTTAYQTFDDSINFITNKMDKVDMLKDGGTTIYKYKDLDLTITVCNTLDNNRDVFFDNYKSDFDETMCK